MHPFLSLLCLLASLSFMGLKKIEPKINNLDPLNPAKKTTVLLPGASRPQVLICLDPGHGGEDTGAKSRGHPQVLEKDLNLRLAKKVQKQLTQEGWRVVMTRSRDSTRSLEDRVRFSEDKKATLFVSLHFNAAPNTTAEGFEVFYYQGGPSSRKQQSKRLAYNVRSQVIQRLSLKDRGIKHGSFHVIRETKIPAILIESGFISNSKELQRIMQPSFFEQLAQGIAKGISLYAIQTSSK